VKDTGIGIPPERMHRLFKSFSQVDSSTTRQYGGTGLGLVISKSLVEMMGGRMWVESEVGKGSAFNFEISAEASPHVTSAVHDREPKQLTGRRVLIVEENATNRRILSQQAKALGMIPQETPSSLEALEWIRRGERFDLAIIDMEMPEMDGRELAKQVRDLQDAASPPMVMLIPIGLPEKESADAKAYFQEMLLKPIKQSRLRNVLTGIFDQKSEINAVVEKRPTLDAGMAKRRPLRILLAEDNAVNQKLGLRLLEKLGYHADCAVNGVEVLDAVQRQTYDVVLMDVQMPEMDGLEAANAICRLWPDKDQRPRMVAMTANAMQGDRERCIEAGMDDYISKPVKFEELVKALEKCGKAVEAAPEVIIVDSSRNGAQLILDAQVLDKFRELMGEDADDFFIELIELYLSESPKLVEELRAAVRDHNPERLMHAAHSLKSSSANVGAISLSARLKELEQIGRSRIIDGAEEKLSLFEDEFVQVRTALEGHRKR
jgi:CheY-like chemotaxis protein